MSKFQYWVLDTTSTSPIPRYRSAWAEGCPMPDCYLKGRPVYIGDVYHGSDPEDTYIDSATYADDDSEVDSDDLYEIEQSLAERLHSEWYECMGERAETWADRDR